MAEQKGGRPIAASQRPTGGDKALATAKKQYFRRKKVCRFCVEKIDDINYKDVKLFQTSFPREERLCRAAFPACARLIRSGSAKPSSRLATSRFCPLQHVCSRKEFAMEIILREDVEKVGTRGSIVKVADGYARNFLFPKRLAVPATEANKKIVEQEREAYLRREAKAKSEAEDLARMLASVSVTIRQRVGENNQ